MVCECFSRSETEAVVRISGKMDRFVYKGILENLMLPFAGEEMLLCWRFHLDNYSKHTAKLIKGCFTEKMVLC